jgi:hypothetical protein
MKNKCQKSAGSLQEIIPIVTAPMGNSCVAFISNNILMVKQTAKLVYKHIALLPEAGLAFPTQAAKPTSNKPAMMSNIQFMVVVKI